MKQTVFVSLVLSLFFCVGFRTCAEEISLGAPESLEVRIDTESGMISSIIFQNARCDVPGAEYMPFDFMQNEKWIAWGKTTLKSVEKIDENSVVSRFDVNGEWLVSLIWALDSKLSGGLSLRAQIAYNGKEETKMKALWWRFPTLAVTDSSYVFAPGQFPPEKTKVSELTGKRSAWQTPGICQLRNDLSAIFMIDYFTPDSDNGGTEFGPIDTGLRVSQLLQVAARMKPGDVQRLGTAYVWFVPVDGESALRRVHEWHAAHGFTIPADRASFFPNASIYEFHPGGTIGSNCKDLGGFVPAAKFAPRIAEIGVNTAWMMPVEDASIYCPNNYYAFQSGLGTGTEYGALVKSLHDVGLYVLQDCVPHGGRDKNARTAQHPEWLAYKEDGTTFDYWCFDFNWPTWRDYMRDWAHFYIQNYGVDGFRVDAVGGSRTENWNPEIPYDRASFAKMQGGLNMLRSIREGAKGANPDAGLLAEVGTDNYGVVSDAVYDFAGSSIIHRLRTQNPGEFVKNLRRWLHECQYGSLDGLLRLRYIENHDTLRSAAWFGLRPARALFAYTTFIDGMPLIYMEQEIGNADEYRKLLAIREALPELRGGACDYLGVNVPDGVFAVEREKDGNRTIALVNFNFTPVTFPLELANLPDSPSVTDMTTAEVLHPEGALEVALKPYEYKVYALRKVAFQLPEFRSQAKAELRTARTDGQVTLAGPGWEADLNTETGMLASYYDDGRRVLDGMRLELPNAECPRPEGTKHGENYSYKFRIADSVLTLTYSPTPEGLKIGSTWQDGRVPEGATLLFSCADADFWSANTAEGTLRDRILFRNESSNFDTNSRHGIYWRTLLPEVLYDSCVTPLWTDAFLTAETGTAALTFRLPDTAALPARVQWRNRIRWTPEVEQKSLVAALAWRTDLQTPAVSAWNVLLAPGTTKSGVTISDTAKSGTADGASAPLLPVAGGYRYENDFYILRISRTGTMTEFVRKSQDGKNVVLFKGGNLYTDYGFGEKGRRYSSDNEVEVYTRLESVANGGVRLHFEGRLRDFDRFGRLHNTVSYVHEYVLDSTPVVTCRLRTDAPGVVNSGSAFLSMMWNSPVFDSYEYLKDGKTLAAGRPLEVAGRSHQTKKMEEFPDAIRLSSGNQLLLTVHGWVGDTPANVFLDRTNFFITVYDDALGATPATVQDYSWKFEVER